jgi:hypothetical protein
LAASPSGDYPTWKAAFDRFADPRSQAGVTAHRIRLLEEDPGQIVIDLDFDASSLAHAFSALPTSASGGPGTPALVGAPTTRVLVEPAD